MNGMWKSASIRRPKKKRKTIDLELKMKVIDKHESGIPVTTISRDLGLPHSTVSTILRDKHRIREAVKGSASMKSKIIPQKRQVIFCEMEKLLLTWLEVQVQKCVPLSQLMIQAKARSIFEALKEHSDGRYTDNFIASHGWFQRFKKRFQLHNGKQHSKSKDHCTAVTKESKQDQTSSSDAAGPGTSKKMQQCSIESAFAAASTPTSVKNSIMLDSIQETTGQDTEAKTVLRAPGDNPPSILCHYTGETAIASSMEELDMDNMVVEITDIKPFDESGNPRNDAQISFTDLSSLKPSAISPLASQTLPTTIFSSIGPAVISVSQPSSSPSSTTVTGSHHTTAPTPSHLGAHSTPAYVTVHCPLPTSTSPSLSSSNTSQTTTPKVTAGRMPEDVLSCKRRQEEEMHNLKMKMMIEVHEWKRKEHEKKMAMLDTGMVKVMCLFEKLEDFLDSGISAYEAMAKS